VLFVLSVLNYTLNVTLRLNANEDLDVKGLKRFKENEGVRKSIFRVAQRPNGSKGF